MERNLMFDKGTKINLGNMAVSLLLQKNIINNDDLKKLKLDYGYIFEKNDGQIEALFRILLLDKKCYFAFQKGSLMLININEEQYLDIIHKMEEFHSCLSDKSPNETLEEKNRKEKNNKYLVEKGISINENLSCFFNEFNKVEMKLLDDICKRAITSLIVVQIACDINNGNDVSKSIEFFKPILEKFNVQDCLNSKERRIINKTYTEQDCIDIDWEYEAYWSLCWALSLVDDISDASLLCDCEKAVDFVVSCNSFDEFKDKCKLRPVQEILDMHDLYYRYNWAINNNKVNANTSIGNINASNVIERRRGLEWILSSENDWYNLSLYA